MSKPNNLSRRQFLGQASCAAVGSASLYSTMLNMRMANTAAAQSLSSFPSNGTDGADDYKAMVCIFLGGGNDSYNMLTPRSGNAYSEYATTRDDLALASDVLLPITPDVSDGREYGIHGSMPELKRMFDDGHVAFVANVGTLVEPTTLQQYENESVKLPLGLYSHLDQMMHWQTSVPDQRTGIGWGGRTADLLHGMNDVSNISMNISLSGNNLFQAGNSVTEYSISSYGAPQIEGWDTEWDVWLARRAAIESMIDAQYANLFQQTYGQTMRSAIDGSTQFINAIDGAQTLTTQFSDSELSQNMRMIAQTIAARQSLGMRRQTFFIMYDGWDHHDEVLTIQGAMLTILSKALGEFNDAMVELGVHNDVTTFTASDFARTLTSNGEGSDHGWGGNQIVMGGAVNGRNIFGDYPVLSEGTNLDTGRGVFIPTTSCDEYFSEIALWFGVDRSHISAVFPNLDRFYEINSNDAPIGFLNPASTPTEPTVPLTVDLNGEPSVGTGGKLLTGAAGVAALTAGAVAFRNRIATNG